MNPSIDTAKLVDVQNVASKLASLPEKALLYIAGYAEGVRDATSTSGPPGQVEQDSA